MSTIRRDLVTILGLALAGCAQVGPEMPQAGPPPAPVGIEPLPPIHQTINGGLPRRDPDSRLVGHQPTPEPAAIPAPPPAEAGPLPGPSAPPDELPGVAEEPEAAPIEAAPALPFEPDPALGEHPDAVPPVDLPPLPGEPAFDEPIGPSEAPAPAVDSPATAADPVLPAYPPVLPGSDPALGEHPDAVPPADLPPLPGPSSEVVPIEPLAGPAPDLDAMIPAPPVFDNPALPASPTPARSSPPGLDPFIGTQPDAVPRAEPHGRVEPAPPLPSTPPVVPAPEPSAPADPSVREASDSTALRSRVEASSTLGRAGEVAAWVGNDVITLRELSNAVAEHLKSAPPGAVPTPEERNMIASSALGTLIDRAIILQEARRMLKTPAQWDKFKQYVDQTWLDEELPRLLKKAGVDNQYELKSKLEGEGRSLDQLHSEYRDGRMAREFMMMNLGPKLRVSLPEMRAYYNDHRSEFDREAQVTWREIVVAAAKYPSTAEARGKAEALLDRLRRGEDFARLAQVESDGPTRSEGGLWRTSPGGYAIASVNKALESLPPDQVSPLIEGPIGFHIVRVEARRDAGPARFDEVQDQIREALGERKYQDAVQAYLESIREHTLVSTIFDGTRSAPRQVARESSPSASR